MVQLPERSVRSCLTDLFCRQALPGRYGDGECLYLVVEPSGSKHWVQRLVIQGRRRDLGLGSYPRVSLREARLKAVNNRAVARNGGDPTAEAERKATPTFRELYETVTETRRTAWRKESTAASWQRLFDRHVLPAIGDKLVAAVTVDDVSRIVVPHWQGRNSKGAILRQNIEDVMNWAVAQDYRPDNPAAKLKYLLPRVRSVERHQPSLPYIEMPDMLVAWQALPVNEATRLSVLFIVLTAARLGEVTGATWREIDLAKRKWTVPGPRMKGLVEHQVPLSVQAVDILERARALQGGSSLVFPFRGRGGRTRQVSQGTVSDALRKLGRVDSDGQRIVAHGFRSSFREWAGAVAQVPDWVAEAALAHVKSDKTKRAYARSEVFEARVPLMQAWANYVLPAARGVGGE